MMTTVGVCGCNLLHKDFRIVKNAVNCAIFVVGVRFYNNDEDKK